MHPIEFYSAVLFFKKSLKDITTQKHNSDRRKSEKIIHGSISVKSEQNQKNQY
jgi:hypothetical protein